MSEQAGPQPDSEKDQYPPDAEFGRRAARDEERVDAMVEHGAVSPNPSDEAAGGAEAPRAASKAEPATGDGDGDGDVADDNSGGRNVADEASEDSFPASDPPSSTGSTASG